MVVYRNLSNPVWLRLDVQLEGNLMMGVIEGEEVLVVALVVEPYVLGDLWLFRQWLNADWLAFGWWLLASLVQVFSDGEQLVKRWLW